MPRSGPFSHISLSALWNTQSSDASNQFCLSATIAERGVSDQIYDRAVKKTPTIKDKADSADPLDAVNQGSEP